MEEELTVTKRLVLYAGDGRGLVSNHLIGPLDNIILSLVTDQLKIMLSNELPDNCKDVLLVFLGDVNTTNTDHLHAHFLACRDSGIIVNVFLEVIIWLEINILPFDNCVVNYIDNLVQEDTI